MICLNLATVQLLIQLRLIGEFNFSQIVNRPTNITDKCETLIDHVFKHSPASMAEVSIPSYADCDHYPVFKARKVEHCYFKTQTHTFIQYRAFKNF